MTPKVFKAAAGCALIRILDPKEHKVGSIFIAPVSADIANRTTCQGILIDAGEDTLEILGSEFHIGDTVNFLEHQARLVKSHDQEVYPTLRVVKATDIYLKEVLA
jgi:hypothetical protein